MNPPTHDEIARHARELWQDQGCPTGRDQEIWLEAERQLSGGGQAAFAERAAAETAAESLVEYQITPAVSEQEAIQAALQKPGARQKRGARNEGSGRWPAGRKP